jgi:molybdopterin-guanine dinucleotide biosynthesis protein A
MSNDCGGSCIINPVGDLTAFILAGGKSTRMGTDKAFLQLGGRTLLAHAMAVARAVAGEVRIVGDAARFASFGGVIEDVYGERGPLGGIHAALNATTTDLNLMLAVDLPFVESGLLEYLISQAQTSGAVVTVPRAGGGLQPLCAVYRREFGIIAERSLRAGKNKIDPLFTQVETRVLEEAELLHRGFSAEMFRNLNTPEDLGRASQKQGGARTK